jgi:hypothetical protein
MDAATTNCLRTCQTNSTHLLECTQQCMLQSGWEPPDVTKTHLPTGLAITLTGCLVLLSGLFSGLNLGLCSLDLVDLRVRTTSQPTTAEMRHPLIQLLHHNADTGARFRGQRKALR